VPTKTEPKKRRTFKNMMFIHFQNAGESAGRPYGWTVLGSNQYFVVPSLSFLESGLAPLGKFGAAKASLLEPFDSISDWLLSSPDIDWVLQLREASRTKFVQQYQL
jgi:hypothetical protein